MESRAFTWLPGQSFTPELFSALQLLSMRACPMPGTSLFPCIQFCSRGLPAMHGLQEPSAGWLVQYSHDSC